MSVIEDISYAPAQRRDALIAKVADAPGDSMVYQQELLAMCSEQRWLVAEITVSLIKRGVDPKYIIEDLRRGPRSKRIRPGVGEAIELYNMWCSVADSSAGERTSELCFGISEGDLRGVADPTRCASLGQLHV